MAEFDPKQYTFGRPNGAAIAGGKERIVKFAAGIVDMQSAPLKKLREEIVENDTETLQWVNTTAVLRQLRKADEDVAEGELHLLAAAVLAGAPVARACRDVWMSPEAFKARAPETSAKYILVPASEPKAGA